MVIETCEPRSTVKPFWLLSEAISGSFGGVLSANVAVNPFFSSLKKLMILFL
jgi:hypothetical protein